MTNPLPSNIKWQNQPQSNGVGANYRIPEETRREHILNRTQSAESGPAVNGVTEEEEEQDDGKMGSPYAPFAPCGIKLVTLTPWNYQQRKAQQ